VIEMALRIIGWVWALPLTILSSFLFIFLYLTKQFEKVYLDDYAIICKLKLGSKFARKALIKRGFYGFSFGNFVFICCTDPEVFEKNVTHEKCHCKQQMIYGILFPILWFLESVRIFIFEKDKHSYYDNFFEVEARMVAGQRVKIPKEDCENDRWIFW